MVATRSNKRQRQSSTAVTLITDFPDVVLSNISSYLTQTSSLKLCFAITSQPDSSISKSIMTQHYNLWDSIDFNDMKDLFGGDEITDDNIRWVLTCTDAVHNLKSLKLTNCLSIIGVGLQPLVGSTVLESIDLSLVGSNKSPTVIPAPPISAEVVVPILESIIDVEENVLLNIQLPKKWRVEKSDVLTNFLRKFGRVLVDRGIKCSGYNCEGICGATRTRSGAGSALVCSDVANVNRYGLITFACSTCDRKYCTECRDDELYSFCDVCEKFYCDYCTEMNWCDGGDCTTKGRTCRKCVPDALASCDWCDEEFCSECKPESEWITCQYCDTNMKFCDSECVHQSDVLSVCQSEGCDRANCASGDCFSEHFHNMDCVDMCSGYDENEGCWKSFCTDCRVRELEDKDWNGCPECVKDVAIVTAKANKKLTREVKKLKRENEGLREELEDGSESEVCE